MKTVSVYDLGTGYFCGVVLRVPASDIAANVARGFGFVEGQFDHLSQKVDLKTGVVVDYIPPQPNDDHEWDSEMKRWTLKVSAQELIHRQASARAQIEVLEKKMTRPLSELLSPTTDATKVIAQARLAELTAERDRIAIESGLRTPLELK